MTEITRIYLENEMDLILAHKRSMKLADFTGLSLSGQTSFGTAVSEVCRYIINRESTTMLSLGLENGKDRSMLVALVTHNKSGVTKQDEALQYAAKLADGVALGKTKTAYTIQLEQKTPARLRFTAEQVDEWKSYFRNEKPVSPYEEVRLKNIQLKELAEKLTISEGRYKALAESLPLGIFTSDETGSLVYANNWMQEFSGQDILGINKTKWESVIHKEDLDAIRHRQREENTAEILPSDKVAEYRVKNKAGEYIWHLGSSVPVQDENNALKYWVGYLVDIQAQKLVEETLKDNQALKDAHQQLARYQVELEERIRELNRTNFELEQFAYIASHDLQEPLRKLLVYNDYIRKKFSNLVDKDSAFILDKMMAACLRMRGLITGVLNFSKIQRSELGFKSTELKEVVQQAIENLEQRIKEKNAIITVHQLPAVEASQVYLTQVFENILGNSLKYTRENVRAEISIYAEAKGDAVVIYVQDNGIGFEDTYAEKIFGLFQRLHDKEEFEGTGIGLAICRKIAELHNGTIHAAGKPGSGALFTITLPIVQLK